MDREQRNWARDIFAHYGQEFEPALVYEDNNFFIMDWRDKNGSGNFATRYIVDKEKGDLIIKGDAGDCIASWYNRITVENLACYINSEYYFIEKMQCSTNKYTYEWAEVIEDLNDKKQEYLGLCEEGELDEEITGFDIEEDFSEMESILSGLDLNDYTVYPDELTDLFQKYDSDWFESFAGLGKRVDKRIFLWVYGFQEGLERLRGKEIVRKDR